MISKFRDISIINMGDKSLTIACDSCSGVGLMDCDEVSASGYITGYRTAFVALAETLCLGSTPIFLTNTLSVPMNEYGKDILRGISQAARDAGILDEAAINGSTEDNFKVSVTSLGITVIGELSSPLPRPISNTCAVYLAGLPKYGADVISRTHEILTFDTINKIMSSCAVHDFIPVGSKGISYELSLMQDELCAEFAPSKEMSVDITVSGGPATCAIFASHDINAHIIREIGIPVTKIGELNPK